MNLFNQQPDLFLQLQTQKLNIQLFPAEFNLQGKPSQPHLRILNDLGGEDCGGPVYSNIFVIFIPVYVYVEVD